MEENESITPKQYKTWQEALDTLDQLGIWIPPRWLTKNEPDSSSHQESVPDPLSNPHS